MEWPALRAEVTTAAARAATLLRTAPDPTATVPGLTWSVGQLGAHLVSAPQRYRTMLAEPTPFPERVSALNEELIAAVRTTDPAELATLLQAETSALLDVLGDDGDRAVPFFAMPHTAEGVAGVLLGELLLHGLDLARSQGEGEAWRVEPRQAIAVLRGVLPTVTVAAVPDVARRATGTYHLRIRGGDDWAFDVRDGEATVRRERPSRADFHVSAEPVAFLLVGYGRASRAKAVLTGRMIGWGRKPWLGVRFATLFAET